MMKFYMSKLHPKHLAWLLPLCLSGLMSGCISALNLILSKGFIEGLFAIWLKAWILSWLMAFPLILIFMPLVKGLLFRFVIKNNA